MKPPRSSPGGAGRCDVLTAIPVYNEEAHLEPVLTEVLRYAGDVLVVDDGSTDRTPELLRAVPAGPGHPPPDATAATARACSSAFRRTLEGGYDGLVTLDCDGQHEPCADPRGRRRAWTRPTSSRGAAT